METMVLDDWCREKIQFATATRDQLRTPSQAAARTT
jgi:hypothetical protein